MLHRERNVVRALIVSPDSRVLLVKIVLADRSFWITPGGGIEAGEDSRSALLRELNEEIGRDEWIIGEPVWTRRHRFDFEGETLTQNEHFYWVASDWFKPPEAMPDAHENQYFGGFRWWTADELLASEEVFAPRKLGTCFESLIAAGLPVTPIDVGI